MKSKGNWARRALAGLGAAVAMLALAGVSYGRWLRFIAPPLLALTLLSAAAMVAGARFGIQ